MNTIYLASAWEGELAGQIRDELQEQGCNVQLMSNVLTAYADLGTNPNLPMSVRGKTVYVIHEYDEQMGNGVWQAGQIIAAVRRSGGRPYLIEPCFRCSRGDKVTGRGFSNLKLQIDFYEMCGVKGIVSVDLHADQGRSMGTRPFENLSSTAVVAQAIQDSGLLDANSIMFAPDASSVRRNSRLAQKLNLPVYFDPKTRSGADQLTRNERLEIMVKDTSVLMVDDIWSTGKTLASSIKFLRGLGAQQIIVVVTHGVTAHDSDEAFVDPQTRPDLAFITNTTSLVHRLKNICPYQIINVIPLLAESIRILASDGSLSNFLEQNY